MQFFGRGLLGLVVIVGMLGVGSCLVCLFGRGLQLLWSGVGGFSLDLVQHGVWLSGWSSFLLVILFVFSSSIRFINLC